MKLYKVDIVTIAEAMGFFLDYDQFDVDNKNWMRFKLQNDSLDEKDFTWIWYKELEVDVNIKRGANILFKSGQKAKQQQFNNYYVEL